MLIIYFGAHSLSARLPSANRHRVIAVWCVCLSLSGGWVGWLCLWFHGVCVWVLSVGCRLEWLGSNGVHTQRLHSIIGYPVMFCEFACVCMCV